MSKVEEVKVIEETNQPNKSSINKAKTSLPLNQR